MKTLSIDKQVVIDDVLTEAADRGRRLSKESSRLLVSVGFLVLLYVGFGIAKPVFFSFANFWTLAQQGSILLLVALGGTFVVMMGMIDLSVGSLVTVAAMSMAVLQGSIGVWSVPAAIAITVVIGAANGLIVTMLRLPSFLVTLGTLSIIQAVALLIGNTYVAFQSSFISNISNMRLGGHVPIVAVWALILLVILSLVALCTVFGRGTYAIGGGERVSQILGLPIRRYKIIAFALSGLTCSVAGIVLSGQLSAGTPSIGGSFLLDAVAAIAVGGTALTGGVGGPWATVIGAAIITVLDGGLVVLQVDPSLVGLIKGLVVIIAVYFTMDRSRGLIVK